MGFSSWLRIPTSIRAPWTRAQGRPTPPRFRPHLEALEGRDVPSTLTVANNLDNGSVGSLRYEIGQAKKGDTIVFAPSLDGQTITLGGEELDITKSLTIQGPGAGLLTIKGGADGYDERAGSRVFAVEKNAKVTLSGLTITGGDAIATWLYASPNDYEGGGILNLGTLTVSGCTVSGNYCDPNYSYGGGIYNAGTLTVTGSTVTGNFANPDGGGIYNAGTATVSGCTLSSNGALDYGSAIYNAGTLTVSNSAFSGNYSDTFSGVYIFQAENIYGPYTDGGGNNFS